MKTHKSLFILVAALLPAAAFATADASPADNSSSHEEKHPWAVDVFLHADHFHKSARLNERNWGLGLKRYVPDDLFGSRGEFFGEIGGLRNSQKGEAYFGGAGYTYPFFTMHGIRVSGSIAEVYVDYGAKGKSATATTTLPFISIGYGRTDMNIVYFSRHDGGLLLFSVQRRF